jgi:hypothetical protein
LIDGSSRHGNARTRLDSAFGGQRRKVNSMIENNSTSVAAAFEMLIEKIEADIDFVNQQGSKAFEARDYDGARDALEKPRKLPHIPESSTASGVNGRNSSAPKNHKMKKHVLTAAIWAVFAAD